MKVIFAEDTPVIQRMYNRVFEESGIQTIPLNDGTLVVDTALQQKPDIIVLDVMMPNVNGLDALKALKANPETQAIPVVMLSAYQEDKLLMEAMQSGASRYLLKSNIEPNQVVALLKELAPQAPEASQNPVA